eukprot:TRINITY_DN4613_c0_g1_i2.p1 TRINITY_DN4613_c0_g1~~TRINITY_DN4613_c0_g1_i2.p1  ORF type:complete len:268 (-),score=53.56 TRINITY_DN4613_c0_g1_i2:138-941(-)
MGWRYAFLITAIPGVMIILLPFVRMPEPGESEKGSLEIADGKPATMLETLKHLATSPQFLFALAGNIAFAFAKGVMGDWSPTFLSRNHGFTTAIAAAIAAGVGTGGGILGGLTGGIIVRIFTKWNPHLLVSGISAFIAAGFAACFIFALQDNTAFVMGMLALSAYFSWFSNGAVISAIVESAPPKMRARTIGIAAVMSHLLGDAISPSIAGAMSDVTNLRVAMAVYPEALRIAGEVWIVGWIVLHTCARPKKYRLDGNEEEAIPLTN